MNIFRDAWFLARKDAGYMLRRRETLLWTFVMPIVFFYFIGTVTQGFDGGEEPDVLAVLAPPDAGPLFDQVVRRLEEQDYTVARVAGEEELRRHGRRLVIPPGFTASVAEGERVTVRLALGEEGLGTDYDRVRVARALYTVLADLVVGREEGEQPGPELFERLARVPRSLELGVRPAGKRRELPRGFEQTIPGTTVMFTILVLLTSGAALLVMERREGLLRRLASAPLGRGTIVLGKWAGRMMLALVQIAFALLAGSLLFRMDWGPNFPMVAVVLLAWAGLNASLGLLLGSLAATEGQAVAIGVLGANILAALGGCWWPIEITPGWMQALSRLLPTGWAMDAMHRLVSFEAGAASALPHLAVIVLAALAAGWLAARSFRFQ